MHFEEIHALVCEIQNLISHFLQDGSVVLYLRGTSNRTGVDLSEWQTFSKLSSTSAICWLLIDELFTSSQSKNTSVSSSVPFRINAKSILTGVPITVTLTLFVFSINGPKQNARSLLTSVSDTDFYVFLCGSLHFILNGSSNNRLFLKFC